MIDDRFSPDDPVSMAQGRHGEMIIVQGNGVRPARWDGSGTAIDAGMDAPATAPDVSADATNRYYVARVDVQKPGAVYYAPPVVSFSVPEDSDPADFRSAKASSYLSQAAVSEVLVTDGGKYYSEPPSAELSDTHGKGAVLEAILDIPDAGEEGPPDNTGLRYWSIVEGPPFPEEVDYPPAYKTYYNTWGWVDLPIDGDGEYQFTADRYAICPNNPSSFTLIRCRIPYFVSGSTGTGAKARVRFAGNSITCECSVTGPGQIFCRQYLVGAWRVDGVAPAKRGTGYTGTVTVTVRADQTWDIDNQRWVTADETKNLVLEADSGESSAAAPRYAVKEIRIVEPGEGYLVVPQIKIVSDSGFGAYATCTVKDGKIDTVTLENGGGGYKSAPTVEVVAGGAEVFAVARPHLRGKYQCYYRYVDNTPEDKGGPIPSNLSPVKEVDTGDGTSRLVWDVPPPEGRASRLELWRTTGNQATTLYRVATLEVAEGRTFTGNDQTGTIGGGGGGGGDGGGAECPDGVWLFESLPGCEGVTPPPPSYGGNITITHQPRARKITPRVGDPSLGDRDYNARPHYEVKVGATGPGFLSYQWQGAQQQLSDGTITPDVWVDIPQGWQPDCPFPPCGKAYVSYGGDTMWVYWEQVPGGRHSLFKKHRVKISSSVAGVEDVYTYPITDRQITGAS